MIRATVTVDETHKLKDVFEKLENIKTIEIVRISYNIEAG